MLHVRMALFLALIHLSSQTVQAGEKFVVVDGFYTNERVQLSLDAVGLPQSLPDATSNVTFSGFKQSQERGVTPLRVVIDQKAVQNLGLVSDPEQNGLFHVLLGGQRMATKNGNGNLSVWIEERIVPQTSGNLRRLVGRSTDGRLMFSSTDDPVPVAIVVVAAGLGLVCGVVYLAESWRESCGKNAIEQCGQGNVESYTEEALIGFKWDGGPEIGCGKSCLISCSQ